MAPSSDEARRKMRELSPRGPRRCAQTLRRRRRSPRSASWRWSACPGTEIASSTPLRRKTGRRVVGKSCAPSWSTSWSARSTCGGPRPSAGAEPWQSRPTPCFGGGESSCTSKSRAPTPQRSGATPTRLSTPTRRSFTSSTTAWATTTPWSKSSSLTRWPRRGRSRRRRFASLRRLQKPWAPRRAGSTRRTRQGLRCSRRDGARRARPGVPKLGRGGGD